MKNFFSVFNFEKSRENGRFLFKTIEKREVSSEQLAKIEALKGFQKERLPLAVSAETHQELEKLNTKKSKKKAVEKTSNTGKESTKKLAENNEKKEFTPQEAKTMAQEVMKKVALNDPEFQKILESDDPRQGIREYTENPSQKARENFLKYLKEYSDEHNLSDHFNWAVDKKKNLGNFGKIFAAFFTVGALRNEGGFMDSFKEGLKWGGIAAALSHPAFTGTVSHLLKGAGKISYNIVKYPTSMLVDFVYNPGKFSREFYDRLKKGENPFVKDGVERTSEMLKTSTDPLFLRAQGMQFSPELNIVLDGINKLDNVKSSDEKTKILEKIRPKAIQFLAQTENLAKGISHKDIVEMGRKIWENDPKNPPQDSDYRLVLMMKSREKIKEVFANDNSFDDEVAHKLQSIKNNLNGADKDKLKELGVEDLDKVIAVGGKNFAKMTAEKKHGIRRALSNMSGTALITYILMFLLTKGLMWGSGLWKKDVLDKRKEQAKKIVTFIPLTLWKAVTWPVRAIRKKVWRKKIGEMGKDSAFGGWNEAQTKLWEELPKKEKNKAVKALFEKIKANKKKLREEKKEIKKRLKGRKNKKERKAEIKKAEEAAETKAKKLSPEEFKDIFKNVKTKDGKDFQEELKRLGTEDS